MNKQHGRFSTTGHEYIISNPHTPRHWFNYLWNGRYVSIFSQLGQGESFSQDGMGNRIPLVAARMLFLRDGASGQVWSANGLPLNGGDSHLANYHCTHGLGYSTINLQQNGIESTFRIFVPNNALCEVWTLTLRNLGESGRFLQIFPFIDTLIDGPSKPQAYYMSSGRWDSANQAVVVTADCDFDGHRRATNFLTCSHPIVGYDSRERAFIGYGTWQNPDAVANGACSSSGCEMEKPILALQTHLTLSANEEVTRHFLVGTAFSQAEIGQMRERFFAQGGVKRANGRLQQTIQSELGTTSFNTPNKQLNQFANYWLKRQISLGTQWARVRHNGYRDLMQDISAMAFFNPYLALVRFERVLAFQYSSGYAPRTWLNGQILDKDFADNPIWIPFTAYNLIMETADLSILERIVAFNDGSTASIYEHVRRAVDYLWQDRGVFGLCRIRSGDWNDCLDQVGSQGHGVSIWLSMAWLRANQQFIELARLKDDAEQIETAERRAGKMRQAIVQHGWDGNHFLRAYNDNGDPIGSQTNTQGTLFLNSQTWAVLCGLQRGRAALEFAESRLNTNLGILSVENAFSEYDPQIGLMSRKTPGIQENGGVYLHANAFKLVADCLLQRPQAVEQDIAQMLPFGRDGEPYVFSNCYFAINDSYRYGTAGQSWGTGTAGWFYIALLNHVFGLQPQMAGLRLNPCLPSSWTNCGVKRPFRGALYEISYQQTGGNKHSIQVTVNGQEWTDSILPYEKGKKYQVNFLNK